MEPAGFRLAVPSEVVTGSASWAGRWLGPRSWKHGSGYDRRVRAASVAECHGYSRDDVRLIYLDAGDQGSNPALLQHRSRASDHPIKVPRAATPTLPDADLNRGFDHANLKTPLSGSESTGTVAARRRMQGTLGCRLLFG